MSQPEDLLGFQLKAINVPFEREVQFAKESGRKWRADFVVRQIRIILGSHPPTPMIIPPLLIEIDGGAYSGGRHVRGAGYAADIEKFNAAVLLGYRVLHFLPEQVESGVALQTIEKALA